jgi:ammonium transporter, Amt family
MINLSATSICNEHFLATVSHLIEAAAMPAEKICFEITETAAVANLSKAIVFIRDLKRLGCRFALDDFGSGMASFGYLRTLPVDYIKIDGAFIKDLTHDPLCTEIIQPIVRIASVMEIKTVAECVEEPGILAELKALGVDYAQG